MLNTLPDIEHISAGDIDISHSIPSKRCDGKRVVMCKSISRRKKIAVLNAKKNCCNFKFENNDIFINEYLRYKNRHLFAITMGKNDNYITNFFGQKAGNIYAQRYINNFQ